MSWLRLSELNVKERDLQRIFDEWHSEDERCLTMGAPAWLKAIDVPNERTMFRARPGYTDFNPDVLWALPDQTIIVELKSAVKYEPLAIGQVSHYAWMLDEGLVQSADYARPIVPVIITPYHGWIRGALSFLRKKELRADAIRYLEFNLISALREPYERLIWFDDPFAAWRLGEPPGDLDPAYVARYSHWYYVEETQTWFGLNLDAQEEPMFQKRPLVLDRPYYTMVSQVDQEPGVFGVWHGPPNGEGTYELFVREEAAAEPPPRTYYRRGPSRRGAKESPTQTVATVAERASGSGLTAYHEWRSAHAHEYAGQWVALRDGRVIDSDPSRKDLLRRLQESPDLAETLFIQVGEPG